MEGKQRNVDIIYVNVFDISMVKRDQLGVFDLMFNLCLI